jgi:hypothetical protein
MQHEMELVFIPSHFKSKTGKIMILLHQQPGIQRFTCKEEMADGSMLNGAPACPFACHCSM